MSVEPTPNHNDSVLTWVIYFAGLFFAFIEPVNAVLKTIAIIITIAIGCSKLQDIYNEKFKDK